MILILCFTPAHYIYYKGSVPASAPLAIRNALTRGHRALLYSPAEFEGCFCLRFYCHMDTDGEARLRLWSTFGQKYMDATEAITEWTEQAVTIDFGTKRGAVCSI